MQKIRIVHFVTSFAVGGTERHITNVLRGHDRHRFDPLIACLQGGGAFLSELEGLTAGIREFPISRLYGPRAWAQQLRAAAYLKKQRVDIVQAYGFYSNCFIIPAARLAGVPVIIASIRDTGTPWTTAQRRVERVICRLAHSVMTNAEACKDMLVEQGYDPTKIRVIPNGIDIDGLRARNGKSTLRADLGIEADAPLIGTIARIDECKGLEYFIDAAALVSPQRPEARFVIVGGNAPSHAEYRRALEERGRDRELNGKLFFAGSRTDVPELLRELEVSVLSSVTEGLPNAVLESMAAGVPVVATRVGGVPEIITDGLDGFTVPSKDPESLAAAINRLLASAEMRRVVAQQGSHTVEMKFTRERMVRATEEHYLRLFEAQGKGRRDDRSHDAHGSVS